MVTRHANQENNTNCSPCPLQLREQLGVGGASKTLGEDQFWWACRWHQEQPIGSQFISSSIGNVTKEGKPLFLGDEHDTLGWHLPEWTWICSESMVCKKCVAVFYVSFFCSAFRQGVQCSWTRLIDWTCRVCLNRFKTYTGIFCTVKSLQ